MKVIRKNLIGLAIISGLIGSLNLVHAQAIAKTAQTIQSAPAGFDESLQAVEATTPVPAGSVPPVGTFYSALTPMNPPVPGNFNNAPAWSLGDGIWLLDDLDQPQTKMMAMGVPSPGDGGSSSNETFELTPDTRRNYTKFANQVFSLIDTNSAAVNDTNLFNVCASIPNDTNFTPRLQIAHYGANAIVIKASHFDFSSETRDFALLVCDKVETPIWKSIDFAGVSDNQDGWLAQGTVPNWQVADPMFFMVTNVALDCNAFFCAIPYGGPQVSFNGVPQPNDTVSNTITLNAQILDLSGVTNDQFGVTVDGLVARYTLSASNTVNIETKYNPNDWHTVYLNVNNKASVYVPTNAPGDTKLFFSGSGSIPLNFVNHNYLLFASDNASPSIGENYFLYVIDKAQNIDATISDPSNGQVVAHYAGYVPYPATVELPWNFTESDGVTAYSNDTYVITFIAFDPDTFTTTNTIDRHGVRAAAGNILTYEEEDPATSAGLVLNGQANTYVGGLAYSYVSLYDGDFFSQTLYTTGDIGANRDNPSQPVFPLVLTHGSEQYWASQTLPALGNITFSDFTFYMGHGNGTEIGGGPAGSKFVNSYLDAQTAQRYVISAKDSTPNWRMRKVALWACYTDTYPDENAGVYSTWPGAFGIRPTAQQLSSWMMKNAGLFFGGLLPQGPYSGTFGGTSVEVAVDFDDLWMTGPNPYPGGCDPTYSFAWALHQTRGMNPELEKANPALIGFTYLPYAGVYDGELVTNNVSHVKN